MAYATVTEVQARMNRTMSTSEQTLCATLLDDAALIIDAYNANADLQVKNTVTCRMIARQLGDGESDGYPMGATQGSMSALGYSQSWTMGSGGANGELYLSKLEKKLLGVGNRIGSYSPIEELT